MRGSLQQRSNEGPGERSPIRRSFERVRRRLEFGRLLWSVDRRLTAALSLTVGFTVVYPLALAVATGVLIGRVVDAGSTGFDDLGGLGVPLAVVAALLGARQLIALAEHHLASSLSAGVSKRLGWRVMAAALAPNVVRHLEDPDLLDQLTRASGVQSNRYTPDGAVGPLAFLVGARLSGLLAAAYVATVNLLLATALVVVWCGVRRQSYEITRHQYQTLTYEASSMRRSIYLRELALGQEAAKEIRLFGLADWVVAGYRQALGAALEPMLTKRSLSWSVYLWFVLLGGAYVLAFGWLVAVVGTGGMSIGRFAATAQALIAIGGLGAAGLDALFVEFGVSVVPEVDKLEATSARLTATGRADPPALESELALRGIEFSYPGPGPPVLEGLDLAVRAGESLAIVGANGAGKTTLVKLITGLEQPTAGSVVIDGIDLATVDGQRWHDRLAVVLQSFGRYPLSAADNIALGAARSPFDADRVRTAARQAGADAFIDALADGYDTVLSPAYEDGVDLSGGQWQRIAIARALYAVQMGATLLVLDEPTSNLDVRAEAELFSRFVELTAGVTTILISHRFSTVRAADRIVVLHEGRIVENGAHDKLIDLNGHYARMFRLQASAYVDG